MRNVNPSIYFHEQSFSNNQIVYIQYIPTVYIVLQRILSLEEPVSYPFL